MADKADSFLSRWSQRKAGVRAGTVGVAEAAAVEAPPDALQPTALIAPASSTAAAAPAIAAAEVAPTPASAAEAQAPPPPTMADVALLTRESDYTRYLGGNVNPEVKNAALKHLFTDPHFNVMDGLDTYIGDYNTPDPLPAGMLRQMVQSQLLGLFDDEVEADAKPGGQPADVAVAAAATPAAPVSTPTADLTPLAADENPDLQLQPDDDAGRPGAEPGAGPHAGRPD